MTPKPDLDAIERRLLPYDVIPHGPQDDGSLLLCFNDDGDTDVGAAWGRHRDAFADYVASSRTDLRALLAEVREARVDGARAMRQAILRVERWSAGGVQAILDLDPATVVGVATTVPDETIRAHEPAPCPGCAGDLAGLVDAVCPTCRAALTVAFAPVEVPRG